MPRSSSSKASSSQSTDMHPRIKRSFLLNFYYERYNKAGFTALFEELTENNSALLHEILINLSHLDYKSPISSSNAPYARRDIFIAQFISHSLEHNIEISELVRVLTEKFEIEIKYSHAKERVPENAPSSQITTSLLKILFEAIGTDLRRAELGGFLIDRELAPITIDFIFGELLNRVSNTDETTQTQFLNALLVSPSERSRASPLAFLLSSLLQDDRGLHSRTVSKIAVLIHHQTLKEEHDRHDLQTQFGYCVSGLASAIGITALTLIKANQKPSQNQSWIKKLVKSIQTQVNLFVEVAAKDLAQSEDNKALCLPLLSDPGRFCPGTIRNLGGCGFILEPPRGIMYCLSTALESLNKTKTNRTIREDLQKAKKSLLDLHEMWKNVLFARENVALLDEADPEYLNKLIQKGAAEPLLIYLLNVTIRPEDLNRIEIKPELCCQLVKLAEFGVRYSFDAMVDTALYQIILTSPKAHKQLERIHAEPIAPDFRNLNASSSSAPPSTESHNPGHGLSSLGMWRPMTMGPAPTRQRNSGHEKAIKEEEVELLFGQERSTPSPS